MAKANDIWVYTKLILTTTGSVSHVVYRSSDISSLNIPMSPTSKTSLIERTQFSFDDAVYPSMASASKWVHDRQIDQIDPSKTKGCRKGAITRYEWTYEWSYVHLKLCKKRIVLTFHWHAEQNIFKLIGHMGFFVVGIFVVKVSGSHSKFSKWEIGGFGLFN